VMSDSASARTLKAAKASEMVEQSTKIFANFISSPKLIMH